jgi:hypothetical protein
MTDEQLPDHAELLLALNAIEGLPEGFNLQLIVDAIRPFLRMGMPEAQGDLASEGWNILRKLDGSEELLVCRHEHEPDEECEWEIWVRKE